VELQTLATGYVRSPVFNGAGIDGAYDFTLSYVGSKPTDNWRALSRDVGVEGAA